MKIRTSELTELQLDYLIANIEGRTIRLDPMGFGKQSAGDSSVSPAFSGYPPTTSRSESRSIVVPSGRCVVFLE